MSFISLPTGKLHKKTETKKLKTFPAGYIGRFYRDIAINVDSTVNSDFHGRIPNDYRHTIGRCSKISFGN